MDLAKPVIGTARQLWCDIIVEGETGLLVPPGDAEALAAALVPPRGGCSGAPGDGLRGAAPTAAERHRRQMAAGFARPSTAGAFGEVPYEERRPAS